MDRMDISVSIDSILETGRDSLCRACFDSSSCCQEQIGLKGNFSKLTALVTNQS